MENEFNPSKRTVKLSDFEEDKDYIAETIREASLKFVDQTEKDLIILIMAVIRTKMRGDSTFGKKLSDLLELEKYLRVFLEPGRREKLVAMNNEVSGNEKKDKRATS